METCLLICTSICKHLLCPEPWDLGDVLVKFPAPWQVSHLVQRGGKGGGEEDRREKEEGETNRQKTKARIPVNSASTDEAREWIPPRTETKEVMVGGEQ